MKSAHAAAITIVAIVVGAWLVMSYVPAKQGAAPLSIGGGAQVTLPQQAAGQASVATVQIGDGQPKPIANLRSRVKDCNAGTYFATTQVGRAIQVYAADTDPSNANANPILNMTAGGSDTTAVLSSNTDYKVVFVDLNDPTTTINHGYYDKSYFGGSRGSVKAGKLTAPATTTATVDVTLVFDGDNCVKANATFVNLFNGNSTTGNRLNGQSNYSRFGIAAPAAATTTCGNGSGSEPEVVVGRDCYPDNVNGYKTETIYYNQTVGDGTFYIDLEFGASGANKVIQDAITCFKDSDGDLNKTQFSAISTSHISGDSFDVPNDLLNYFKNDQCFTWLKAGTDVNGGKSGIYRLTFTTAGTGTSTNWEQGQEFEIVSDDMGGWFAQDIRNSRVVAQSIVTIDTSYKGNDPTISSSNH